MSIIEQDLRGFENFVLERLEEQSEELTLEDYVCLWRSRRERDEVRVAIQEGLDDLAAGRVRPAGNALAEMCGRLA